jgi:CRISPR-associated endonuclease/helicase Cas3
MYGAELLAYLVFGVKKIIEMGGKVAVVTATLPPFIKDLFGNDFKYAEFIDDNKLRHNLVVKKENINTADIVNKFNENEEKGKSNKILVICNTIKKAQAVYDEVVEILPKENVKMLHSRFIRKDRNKKEAEIMETGRTDFKGSEIWITTSVVEASLDIDFDYLFTELQDLNSLFQRLGRCNRKGEKPVDEPNCYVYTEIDSSLLNVGKGKGFIDGKIYSLSREAILTVSGVLKESQKLELINKYFSSEKLAGSEFMRKYKQVYDGLENLELYKLESNDVDLRHISSVSVIPKSVYDENEELIDEIGKNIPFANSYEKIKLIDELNDFTVSIPYYEFVKSKKYGGIPANKREIASVIECDYSEETGFKVIADKDYIATFW